MSTIVKCDCIALFNAAIEDRNSMLETNLFTGGIVIKTIPKTFGVRRKPKPPYLIATFCPMCGTAYRKSNQATFPSGKLR